MIIMLIRSACAVLAAGLCVSAAVKKIDVVEQTSVLNGRAFGKAGPYERIIAKAHFTVDPALEANQQIRDLKLAPKNSEGLVEDPPIAPAMLDGYLASHCISPKLLRADDFEAFMKERRAALLTLISKATGHAINDAADMQDEGEELSEEIARDSGISTVSE